MKFLMIVSFFVFLAGCEKNPGNIPSPTIQVLDYITGNSIDAAAVYEKQYLNWSFNCSCYQDYTETLVGFTNPSGTLQHMNIEFLEIRKPGYYNAERNKFCYYEFLGLTATYHLFRKGMFEITALTSNTYNTQIALYIYPILRNGKIPDPYSAPKYVIQSNAPFIAAGYGGMNNRIFVVKSGTKDTLYRADVFLPENTTKSVTVDY